MGFEHQRLWGLCFMGRFTKMSVRILCKFTWVFMAISNGCKHQEYLTVM